MALVAACALVLVAAPGALAWKPFMHNYTGDRAWEDVVDDGHVTINGRSYDVPQAVEDALRNQKPYFNAGVVGPDGFPDLVYGQSVIHSAETGKWLQHILAKAWQAQSDPTYSATQSQQVLAFAYGYATHAAGDMWAHTFINDHALGVFPTVGEILTGVDDAEIALRHLIAEGYVGDATPGYDGNADRTQVPMEVNEDGDPDFSDNASPRIPFQAPTRFIYETLVNPNNPLPVGTCGDGIDDDSDSVADDGCPGGPYTHGSPEPKRGKLLDFFLTLKANLQLAEARADWDSSFTDCNILDPDCYSRTKVLTVHTVRGTTTTTVDYQNCEGATIGCVASPVDAADDIINNMIEGYLEAWIEDIDTGVRQWPQLGLAVVPGDVRPGTHRDAQNEICRNKTAETTQQRADCEDGVGIVDVMLYSSEDYIEDHLLSMAGAPDAAGDLVDMHRQHQRPSSDVLGPLNPITAPLAEVKEYVTKLIKDEIAEAFGIDIDHIKSFLLTPTHWLNVQSVTLNLPILGPQTLDLFQPDTHERLDAAMRLSNDHHPCRTSGSRASGVVSRTGLADDAVWSATEFEPYLNTVQQAKLLLLGRRRPERRASSASSSPPAIVKPTATISTYADGAVPANVMVDGARRHDLAALDRLRSRVAGRRPAAVRAPAGAPDRRQGQLPDLGVVPRPPGLPDDLPRLGERDAAVPGARRRPVGPAGRARRPCRRSRSPGNTVDVGGATYVGAKPHVHADGRRRDVRTGRPQRSPTGSRSPAARPARGRRWRSAAASRSRRAAATASTRSSSAPRIRATRSRRTRCRTAASRRGRSSSTRRRRRSRSPRRLRKASSSTPTTSRRSSGRRRTAAPASPTEAVTFDGAASTQGAVLDMFLLAPGTHTIVVQAADKLGNASSADPHVQGAGDVRRASSRTSSGRAAEGLIDGAGCATRCSSQRRARGSQARRGRRTRSSRTCSAPGSASSRRSAGRRSTSRPRTASSPSRPT